MKKILLSVWVMLMPLPMLAANVGLTYNSTNLVIIAPTNQTDFYRLNNIASVTNLNAISNSLQAQIVIATNMANQTSLSNRVTVLEGQTNSAVNTNQFNSLSNRVTILEGLTNSTASSTGGVNRITVSGTNCTGNLTFVGRGLDIQPDVTHSTLTFRVVQYITKNIVPTNEVYEYIVDIPRDDTMTFSCAWGQTDAGKCTIDVLSGPANTPWRSWPITNYGGFVCVSTGAYGSAWSSTGLPAGYKMAYHVTANDASCSNVTFGVKALVTN